MNFLIFRDFSRIFLIIYLFILALFGFLKIKNKFLSRAHVADDAVAE